MSLAALPPLAASCASALAPTRTRVKICGLTSDADVQTAVNAGADALGFNLYPGSPRYVGLERAAAMARHLPPFVTPVLLFVNATAAEVRAACERLPHALLQFHGDESPAECLASCGTQPFLRAARIPLDHEASFDLLRFAADFSAAQALLLDAHVQGYGGGGKAFDWSRLPPNVPAHLVLSGGLTPANVGEGIRALRTRGLSLAVDVSSGVEAIDADGRVLKGIKDAGKVQEFVAAVRAADVQFAN